MQHVRSINPHGEVITDEEFDDYGKASIRFCRMVLRQPGVHLQWIDGEELPGMPPKVVGQRFGNPCEAPCCVPLAEAWEEQDPGVTGCDTRSSEREERP